ncbi:unnamed protein product [Phytophthora fragariaefolia]|uniref:Unnamed protein product n=1 Tax=Phytophthora fragariaefolia TaxID=1490495 RepID=A0A9W6XCF2_9STRA|nr:unnamed protein product [Phytophthora fragariaefolia]
MKRQTQYVQKAKKKTGREEDVTELLGQKSCGGEPVNEFSGSNTLYLADLLDVKDKVVVITGGGRGIGKMMANGFVQNGAKVYIASRNLAAIQATANELNAKGPGECFALQADLQSEKACKQLAEDVAERESKVDVLINNSGVGWGGDIEHHPEKAWTKVLSANVMSPFHLTRYFLPLLDAAAATPDAARVINIGSVAGLMPQQINTIAYDTSKGAIHHMTRVLAAKLARRPNGDHILVNAIAPGLVPTKLSTGIALVTGKSFEELQKSIPIERYGNESDMAGLAIFLASKASGWITGMVIASDGGQVFTMETDVVKLAIATSDVPAEAASKEPAVNLSVLQKFLSLRGLTPSQKPRGRAASPPRLKAVALSKTYTKRRHRKRTEAQRAALREPEDVFSNSVDAYVPRKRKQELMDLHKDELEVSDVFLSETRALSFEREVLDKVVCDREENRELFEERLWQLMIQERGLQPVEDEDDNHDKSCAFPGQEEPA